MKQKTARIISLSIIFLFVASLFSWSTPVSAGVSEWTAETIPGRLDNSIGPPGIDVRDFAIGNDDKPVYAVPGNSIAGNVVYKSINAGVSWTALTVSIRADLVAIAPDDVNIIAIANNSTPEVNLSIDGGVTWYALGTPQALAGAPAAAIFDIAISGIWEKKHFIAAAGQEAGNVGNLWYFAYGAAAATWQETNTLPGATAESEVAAIDFSDSFSSDATLVAVTDSTGVDVKLQVLNIDSLKWNGNAGYIGYPCTVVSNAGINRLTSASLTLSPGYDGSDEGSRDLFIGLTIDGTAPVMAARGIFLFSQLFKT